MLHRWLENGHIFNQLTLDHYTEHTRTLMKLCWRTLLPLHLCMEIRNLQSLLLGLKLFYNVGTLAAFSKLLSLGLER